MSTDTAGPVDARVDAGLPDADQRNPPADQQDPPADQQDPPADQRNPPAAPSPPGPPPARFWWLALPPAILGLALTALDQSLTGVSYSAMANDLGASNIEVQWVSTINRVGQGVTLPAAAWLAHRYGLRRMYVLSMLLYMVLSTLCGLATNLPTLAVLRFLEGFPGGLVAIVSIGILFTGVPREKMGIAVVLIQVLVLCAPGLGPVIGGVLVVDVQWRAVFWATVALAAIALATSLLLPARKASTRPPPFDVVGFICLSVGIVAVTLAVSKGADWGWTSYPTLILFAVALDGAALFVIVERQVQHPLWDVSMFGDRTFCVGLVLTGVMSIELAGALSFIPTFLKQVQNMSAIDAGLVMVPQALTFVAMVALANRLDRTWGVRQTMVTGLLLLGGGTLLLGQITVDTPEAWLVVILSVRSIGLGLAFVPILAASTSTLPMKLFGDAIQVRTLIQRVLAALVVTYLTAFVGHRQRQVMSDQSGLLGFGQDPTLYEQQQAQPTSLLPLWQELKLHAATQSYGEAFLVLGGLTLASVVLVFVTRWGAPPRPDDVVVNDGA